MSELCKNLKLTILEEPHPIEKSHTQVRVILRDDLNLTECEVCYETNERVKGAIQSERYFLMEAIVLSMRRVVAEACGQGMIKLPPSTLKRPGVQIPLSEELVEWDEPIR
jgi:hypothetical protein